MSRRAKRNIFISLILIASSFSVLSFMVYRVTAQGDELAAQINSLEKDRAQEASFLKLQRISEETRAEREQLQKYFLLRESDSIDFLNKVESLADDMGVLLKTNGLELFTDKEEDAEWVRATFTFSGSREQVHSFIQTLESLPYVLRMTSLNLAARSATEWSADVTMQVRVLAYDE